MNRAPIVLSATVAGLAATLGFQAHAPAVPTAATTTAQTTAPSSTGSTTSGSKPSTSSSSSSSSKTVTSAVAANQYGNVQVRITVANGKITKLETLQVPQNDRKSAEINASAEPILRASALKAQSANIDTVSGATYTSNSYKTALQSALDKAGVSSSATGS